MTYYAKAKKIWKKAEWICGEGRYASLAHCINILTVMLHKTRQEAQKAKEDIDEGGCGGGCYKDHSVVDIDEILFDEKRLSKRCIKGSKKD